MLLVDTELVMRTVPGKGIVRTNARDYVNALMTAYFARDPVLYLPVGWCAPSTSGAPSSTGMLATGVSRTKELHDALSLTNAYAQMLRALDPISPEEAKDKRVSRINDPLAARILYDPRVLELIRLRRTENYAALSEQYVQQVRDPASYMNAPIYTPQLGDSEVAFSAFDGETAISELLRAGTVDNWENWARGLVYFWLLNHWPVVAGDAYYTSVEDVLNELERKNVASVLQEQRLRVAFLFLSLAIQPYIYAFQAIELQARYDCWSHEINRVWTFRNDPDFMADSEMLMSLPVLPVFAEALRARVPYTGETHWGNYDIYPVDAEVADSIGLPSEEAGRLLRKANPEGVDINVTRPWGKRTPYMGLRSLLIRFFTLPRFADAYKTTFTRMLGLQSRGGAALSVPSFLNTKVIAADGYASSESLSSLWDVLTTPIYSGADYIARSRQQFKLTPDGLHGDVAAHVARSTERLQRPLFLVERDLTIAAERRLSTVFDVQEWRPYSENRGDAQRSHPCSLADIAAMMGLTLESALAEIEAHPNDYLHLLRGIGHGTMEPREGVMFVSDRTRLARDGVYLKYPMLRPWCVYRYVASRVFEAASMEIYGRDDLNIPDLKSAIEPAIVSGADATGMARSGA